MIRITQLLFIVLAFGTTTQYAHADSQKPSTPNGVVARSTSDTSVRVSWNAATDNVGVQGYNVYRNGSYHSTVFNTTSYVDSGVSGGNTYNYSIVAFDAAKNYTPASDSTSVTVGAGNGGGSNSAPTPAPATTSAPPASGRNGGQPQPPSDLNAQLQHGNQIRLGWSPASGGNVEGYNVYRNGSYYRTVRNTNYTDTSVNGNQTYRYQLVTFTQDRKYSVKSPEVSVNTAAVGSANDAAVPAPNNTANTSGGGSAPAGHTLVFADEFRGGGIDGSKWHSRLRWGPDVIINNEKQFYVDQINNPDFGHSPFSLDGEHLTISAIPTPEHLRSSARWQPYLSGTLNTHGKFKMKYGYVEMRARMPAGKGLWPAFWMLHEYNNGKRPEIDIAEFLGNRRNVVYNTYHYYDNGGLRSTPTYEAGGPDYTAGFHTFAVRWEPGLIIWYVDGQERNRYSSSNVSNEDMYLIVNLAVGGAWAGNPDGSTNFPARYVIDYIRAYRRN